MFPTATTRQIDDQVDSSTARQLNHAGGFSVEYTTPTEILLGRAGSEHAEQDRVVSAPWIHKHAQAWLGWNRRDRVRGRKLSRWDPVAACA